MARSQNSFIKKEREKKKQQKRKIKLDKKAERKEAQTSSALEDMMVYVDEDGNFVESPPEPTKKDKKISHKDILVSTPKSAPIDYDAERQGKVTFFNDDKGYGFIEQDQTQEKFYFHISQTVVTPKMGNKVKFHIEKGERGFNAVNVQIMR